jgi:hypothetical protein
VRGIRASIVVALLVLLLLVAACGDDAAPVITVVVTSAPEEATAPAEPPTPTPEPPPDAKVRVLDATFAHGLTDEMQPVEPGSGFWPDETIYLSVRLDGRPEGGVVTARFYYGDTFIAEAGVDLGDVNSGVLFSLGEDTFLGYTLTHENPFPVGDDYRAELSYGDELLGTYPFRVLGESGSEPAPPSGSAITSVTLALGADDNYDPVWPTAFFAFDEEVHLVGAGDLVAGTTLQADWYVDGALDETGTRVLTLEEDIPGAGFVFSFLPDGGWPPGVHEIALLLDGAEVGRYSFEVVEAGGAAPLVEPDFWDAFPSPDDAEAVEVVEGVDYGFATEIPEDDLFGYYAAWLRGQGWERVSAEGASGLIQDWSKEGATLHLEMHEIDEQGRPVIWLQFEPAE